MKELTDLEREFVKTLQKVATTYYKNEKEKNEKGNTFKTPNIKEEFKKIAPKNYQVKYSDNVNKNYEWLYDLVWLEVEKSDDGITRLKKIILALESELSRSQLYWSNMIKPDLEKLLITNAEFRVMICHRHPYKKEELKGLFVSSVTGYELLPKGSRIMMLVWDDYRNHDVYYHLGINEEEGWKFYDGK